MTVEPGIVGAVVAIIIAIVAASWRILGALHEVERSQSDAREDLRTEVARLIIQSEERIVRRVERIEQKSDGFNRWRRGPQGSRTEGR